MPDPITFDEKFESLFQSEILCYLSLKEDIQPARQVSKAWKTTCDGYKASWIEALDAKSSVVLLELTSAKGKTLNGNTVKITGKRDPKSHRYPIMVDNWITGETETLNMKICNLNPTATRRAKTKDDTPNLLQYSDNALLRVSHGMMLDQLLMLARWETNIVNGMMFQGQYQEFITLPRGHPSIARLNANMWTWWAVSPKLAGVSGHGPVLDVVGKAILDNDSSKMFAKNDKLWPQDGPQGSYMARNMLRFMRTWTTERVTDEFWVSHKHKTGSIMTSFRDGQLGQVYLVKGHASVIAELMPQLPFCVQATLLPLYDCWTYDGVVTANPISLSSAQKRALDEHVKRAIIEEKVSWRGVNADKWQYPPPDLPGIKRETETEVELDWRAHDAEFRNMTDSFKAEEKVTEAHLELGRQIVKAALAKNWTDPSPDANPEDTWVIRRFGYSYEENPNGIAIILSLGQPVTNIHFAVDHKRRKDRKYVPTYKLEDLLKGILKGLRGHGPRLSGLVQPDELSLVRPLENVFRTCFGEKGKSGPIVHWYPPASAEESNYANTFGHGDNDNHWNRVGP